MFEVSLKLDHALPFCNLSKAFPSASMQRWCNLEVDILEIESPRKEDATLLESGLRHMLKALGARLIRVNRYSERELEAVIRCKCTVENSSVAAIERAGCVPVMPVTYGGGLEYCRLLAFTSESLNRAISRLEKMSSLEVQSKSVVRRESARGAIAIPVDQFFGPLTQKQLSAFMSAMQMGYYSLPKGTTIEEMASRQGMKRSTFEEHLRKAELKILQAVRPYAGLAHKAPRGR